MQSPTQDEFIEKFLAKYKERNLDLKATTDGEVSYNNTFKVLRFLQITIR